MGDKCCDCPAAKDCEEPKVAETDECKCPQCGCEPCKCGESKDKQLSVPTASVVIFDCQLSGKSPNQPMAEKGLFLLVEIC